MGDVEGGSYNQCHFEMMCMPGHYEYDHYAEFLRVRVQGSAFRGFGFRITMVPVIADDGTRPALQTTSVSPAEPFKSGKMNKAESLCPRQVPWSVRRLPRQCSPAESGPRDLRRWL